MSDPEFLSITKLDAARRQLRTAIELWFTDGDAVSTHTLAYAAHEVIHDLHRAAGKGKLLLNSPVLIKEGRENIQFLKSAARFFKHAQHDIVATLDFYPALTEIFLIASVVGLREMEERLNDAEAAMFVWTRIHHDDWFQSEGLSYRIPVERINQLKGVSKDEFFKSHQRIRRKPRLVKDGLN